LARGCCWSRVEVQTDETWGHVKMIIICTGKPAVKNPYLVRKREKTAEAVLNDLDCFWRGEGQITICVRKASPSTQFRQLEVD